MNQDRQWPKKYISVHGKTMAYVEMGDGERLFFSMAIPLPLTCGAM